MFANLSKFFFYKMNEVIEEIKKDKTFRKKLHDDFTIVVNSSSREQNVILKNIFPLYKLNEEAMIIAGDTIYDLTVENEVLQTELEKTKEYDEEKIKKIITTKKMEQDPDKNKIILNSLKRTMAKTKQLL